MATGIIRLNSADNVVIALADLPSGARPDGLGGALAEAVPRGHKIATRPLAKGETVGHIADGMSLSVKTVSTYRSRIMEKMKLASNSDLTYYAMKSGLIQ